MKKVADARWKENGAKMLADLVAKDRVCYHKSPKTNSDGEVLPGYKGMYWIGTSNTDRPKIMDRDGVTPLTKEDGRPYSGCVGNLIVDIWPQNFTDERGKRVNARLLGVQFIADGDAFVTRAEESDFEEVEVDAEAAEFI